MVIEGLMTDINKGINSTPRDLEEREKWYGHNRKELVLPASFCQLFCDALEDFTLRILVVAAIISIAVEVGTAEDSSKRSTAWIEGFAILIAVFVCAIVGAANDYKKEKQFQQLNSISAQDLMVMVFRDGLLTSIHRDKVLVGDIIQLKSGMEIPADGLVLYAVDLKCDESVMTGEPGKSNFKLQINSLYTYCW